MTKTDDNGDGDDRRSTTVGGIENKGVEQG
jgi:hypothetical protein